MGVRAVQAANIVPLEQEPEFPDEASERIPLERLEKLAMEWSPRRSERVKNTFLRWLREAKESSKDGASRIFVLSGEWGSGKTTFARIIFPKIIEQEGLLWKNITFEDLIRDVKNICYNDEKVDPIEAFDRVFTIYVNEKNADHNKPLILLVDEVEGIIGLDNESPIRGVKLSDAFIKMLREFLTGKEAYFGKSIKGRMHLVLFMTPFALNFINEKLASVGFSGWLWRREDICDIYPFNKIEFVEYAKNLIKYMLHGKDPNEIIDDYRVFELLYTITHGNAGLLVKVLREFIMMSFKKCSEENDMRCIYRIDINTLSEFFNEYSIKIPSRGFMDITNAMNLDLVRRILNSNIAKNYSKASELLKKIIFTSSIIFEDELDEISKIVLINFQVDPSMGVKSFKSYRVYRLGSRDSLEEFLDNLSKKLKETNNEVSEEELKICASMLLCLTKDGDFRIAIPVMQEGNIDREELSYIMSSYKYVILPDDIEDFLNRNLHSHSFMNGIGLSSLTKAMLYPVYSPMIIPFIIDPKTTVEIYSFIRRLLSSDIRALENHARIAVLDMLEKMGYAEERLSGRAHIVTPSLKKYENSILSVAVIIGSSQIEDIEKLRNLDNACILVISPHELKMQSKRWNIFFVQMTLQDIEMLAARNIAEQLRRSNYIVMKKLNDFYFTLFNKYGFQKIFEEWASKAANLGILIRERIGFESHEKVIGSKRKPHLVFLDYYRALLIGGMECGRDELEELLFGLYRVRPFEGLIEGLSSFSLPDIEPDNPIRDSDYRILRKKISEIVNDALELAKSVGAAEYDEKTRIVRLQLLPAEKRIIELLKESYDEVSIDDLQKRFVFERGDDQSSKASRQIFYDFILKLLENRGLITYKKRGKVGEYIKYVQLSDEEINKLVYQIEIDRNNIKEFLAVQKIDLNSPICHILLSKQKGSKIIFLSDIDTIIQKYIVKMEITKNPVIYNILVNLRGYLNEIFEKYIKNVLIEVNKILNEVSQYKKSFNKQIDEKIDLLKEIFPPAIFDKINKSIQFDKERYVQYFDKILKSMSTYLGVSRDKLIEEILKSESAIRRNFIVWTPAAEGGAQKAEQASYNHNYILFRMRELYHEEFSKTRSETDKLLSEFHEKIENIKNIIQKYRLSSDMVHRIIREKYLQLYGEREFSGGLPGIIEFLEHLAEELGKKGEIIKQREKLKKTIIEKKESIMKLSNDIMGKYEEILRTIDEIKKICDALNNIGISVPQIKKIREQISQIEKKLEELEEKAGVTLADRLKYLDTQLSTLNESFLESLKEEEMNKLINELDNTENRLKSDSHSLTQILEKIISIKSELTSIIKEFINRVQRQNNEFKEMLANLGADSLTIKLFIEYENQINKLIKEVKEALNRDELLQLIPKLGELCSIERLMKDLVYKKLGEKHFTIYERITRYINERNEPLRFFEVYEEILKDMNINDVIDALLKLDKIGIIKITISKS
ncbi:MAG: hypothetical protein LM590_06770 [Thermofilum sp.]|nr:hypothetical protein [Thermofilum sp.]